MRFHHQRLRANVCGMLLVVLLPLAPLCASQPAALREIGSQYDAHVLPIVKQFCNSCHSTADKEGELDLEQFATFDDVRRDPRAWIKVVEMLKSGEMPPEDADQPTAAEKKRLRDWAERYLAAEAHASAGDPGPVVLRRLSNAEYTYTIQDLTGVPLQPAREFPIDGAAGEGFTNTGSALVMSPALFQKYLDAGKQIAEHAVLLPDGIRFSEGSTRRDWTNEILHGIRGIYLANTSGYDDASKLNRWEVEHPTNVSEDDGRVDLARYFSALIRHRDTLQKDRSSSAAIAQEEKLNAKYFGLIADMLLTAEPKSMLLDRLRERYRTAQPADAPAIAGEIRGWQAQLWRFQNVGHFGSIRKWQQPNDPLPENVTLRQAIDPNAASDITLYLSSYAGAGKPNFVWQRPRIEFKDRPAIALRDIRPLAAQLDQQIAAQLARTEEYLAAVAELRSATKTLETIADERKLDAGVLRNWTNYLDLGRRVDLSIAGLITSKMTKVDGHDAINGWGVPATPCIFANSSDKPISFVTLTVPARGVTVHPSPDMAAGVAWRSPMAGKFRLGAKIADADDKCGNGATWSIELRTAAGVRTLAQGEIDNGRAAEVSLDEVLEIARGEVVALTIGPRNRDHSCDTTHVELNLAEQGGESRTWNLARDVADDIQAGNPHADRLGNAEVWHFFAVDNNANAKPAAPPMPTGSALANWRKAAAGGSTADELAKLANAVQKTIDSEDATKLDDANQAAVRDLRSWSGPLAWAAGAKLKTEVPGNNDNAPASIYGVDPAAFGKTPDGKAIDPQWLFATPGVVEVRLPAALVRGGEFIVDAQLDGSDPQSFGQVELRTSKPDAVGGLRPNLTILSRSGTPAREQLVASYSGFRQLFPATMCYARIVPVDEVVTLVLFHREDEELSRLMLDDADAARLDQLWDQLRYVSQDALVSETALEQILAFATQDSDPRILEPVRKPIAATAAAYRQRLIDTEPAHVDAVVKLAAQAYRRPLAEREARELRELYAKLRAQELPHDEAVRLSIARIFASPAFLYRLEQPGPEAAAVNVSDIELASRLSYFLWSTQPDDRLRELAVAGKLHDSATLKAETQRMLRDERTRRLAIEFACQWLHVRDFHELDEKSQQLFPTFNDLRGDMYEESIRFFADLVQSDGRVLDVLDADYTFLNGNLAQHYGVPNVEGDAWRKVEGVRQFARGGVLTQATVLAKQSGASRTSPILRGNWVSETLLGERLPRPPKDVPLLPDEAPQGLTERQLIEKHSSDAACAKCHARIDHYGFVLEQYDAIGRLRDKDAGGQAIDVKSKLPDGSPLVGVDGLRDYLLTARRDDFVRQFCRKLLGYALGRSVQLSDGPLIDKMMADLAASDYRFSAAVEAIVLSDQFRQIRGQKFVGLGEGQGDEEE